MQLTQLPLRVLGRVARGECSLLLSDTLPPPRASRPRPRDGQGERRAPAVCAWPSNSPPSLNPTPSPPSSVLPSTSNTSAWVRTGLSARLRCGMLTGPAYEGARHLGLTRPRLLVVPFGYGCCGRRLLGDVANHRGWNRSHRSSRLLGTCTVHTYSTVRWSHLCPETAGRGGAVGRLLGRRGRGTEFWVTPP